MIAIVTAIREEAAAIRWPLRRMVGDYSVITTGMGKESALTSMQKFFVDGGKADLVLALGFCGGLTNDLRPGCLVLTRRFLAQNEDVVFNASSVFFEQGEKIMTKGTTPFLVGDSLTVGGIVRSGRQKQVIAKEYGVSIVNMEDYWLAHACAEAGVPFMSVRGVVDTVHDDLPAFVEEFAKADDSGRGLSIALGAIRRPGNILSLLSMAKKASAAKKSLGAFAGSFVPNAISGGIPTPV